MTPLLRNLVALAMFGLTISAGYVEWRFHAKEMADLRKAVDSLRRDVKAMETRSSESCAPTIVQQFNARFGSSQSDGEKDPVGVGAPSVAQVVQQLGADEDRGALSRTIFQGEARDPTWARQSESALRSSLEAEDLGAVERVECRATLCAVELQLQSDGQHKLLSALQTNMPWSAAVVFDRTDENTDGKTRLYVSREGVQLLN